MVHSSTFMFERGSVKVDESAPGGQNEDWDLALRAAARQPIVHVDRPFVRVRWGASKYVTRWADRIAAWDAEGRRVLVYFNNDLGGHAVRNARTLRQLLAARVG